MSFQAGQQVMLSTKYLRLDKPSKKLADRRLGPFIVDEPIGKQAYRLQLPDEWHRIHPVFHVSLLEPYHQDKDAIDVPQATPSDLLLPDDIYKVEGIL